MPVAPKSPRPKKQNGLAKPKGAVRAKSGCYTCRIRRKVRISVDYNQSLASLSLVNRIRNATKSGYPMRVE